jgi:hypothetical protein
LIENQDDDPLTITAALFKIDTKALRASVAKEDQAKARKKAKKTVVNEKSKPNANLARK